MNFTLDPTKKAHQLILSCKVQMTKHPPLFFHQIVVPQTSLQKHLGMFLDSKLNLKEHLKTNFLETDKTIYFINYFKLFFPELPFHNNL